MSKNNNYPRLSAKDIELKAEEVITYFDQNYLKYEILKEPKPTPLLRITEIMQNNYGIFFDFKKDLGISKGGNKILGVFTFKPKKIFVDCSLQGNERFPFVLGHELGHLVFHRNLKVDMDEYNTITDTERDFATGKKRLKTLRDWLEYQANRFSSAILLPRATVTEAILKTQIGLGIKRNLGKVYLNNQMHSKRDFDLVLNRLAVIYQVSKTNVECRLKDLEILIDHRNIDTSHISALLKEE